MSFAVTSFWKSMKALALPGLRSVGSSLWKTPLPVRSAVTAKVAGSAAAAEVAGGVGAGSGAVFERPGDPPEAASGAGDVAGLGALAGQVDLRLGVPAERALGVREEVQRGRPAAAHQERVAE